MNPLSVLPSRSSRRATVIGIWAIWTVAVACRSPLADAWPVLIKAIGVFGALITLGALVVRNYRIGQFIADDADTALDERQIALRNRAYLGAYRLFAGLVAFGACYITVAVDSQWFWYPASRFAWQSIAEGVIVLAMTAPSGWLAWFVPDEEEGVREMSSTPSATPSRSR